MNRGAVVRAVEAGPGSVAAALFAGLSFLRRRRVFHPYGAAVEALLEVTSAGRYDAALLDVPLRRRCLVRLSWGVGLPDRLPDVLGVAVRVLGEDGRSPAQDILFATVLGDGSVSRHVLAPSAGFGQRPFSTVLPYRAGHQLVVLGLAADADEPLPAAQQAADALLLGRLSFRVRVSAGREWATLGRLSGVGPVPPDVAESLRYNPFHASLGLEPAGMVNALRRRSYAASQAARPTPRADQAAPLVPPAS